MGSSISIQRTIRTLLCAWLFALPYYSHAQPTVIRIRKSPPPSTVRSDPRSLNFIQIGAGNARFPHFIIHTGAQYGKYWLWEAGIRAESIQESTLIDAQVEFSFPKEVYSLGVSYQRRITNSTARWISAFAGGGMSTYLVPEGTGIMGTAFLTLRPARGFLRIFQASYGYSIPVYKEFRATAMEAGLNAPHRLSLTINLLSF